MQVIMVFYLPHQEPGCYWSVPSLDQLFAANEAQVKLETVRLPDVVQNKPLVDSFSGTELPFARFSFCGEKIFLTE